MIYGIFGLPGSGKTTLLCKIAKKTMKTGKKVFTNFPCKGCYKLDFQTLGKFNYCDCLLLIDEISLICDSRDWKNFNSDLRYFFTNHRHYNIDIYYCSQWFTDTDVKIRRMTEQLFYVERKLLGLSMQFDVIRDIVTTENGEIADSYKFKHGKLFFRPLYYKMFNSFSCKELPDFEPELWNEV